MIAYARLLTTGLLVLFLGATTLWAQESILAIVPHPNPANQTQQMRKILTNARALFNQQREEAGDDKSALSDAYGRLGMVYQSLQFEDSAAAAYSNAKTLKPDDPRWHHFLAFLYQEKGDPDRAISEYLRVLQLAPDYLAARTRLGLLFYTLDRKVEAEEEFVVVLAQRPNDAAVITGLGRIAMDEGRYQEAIERFERAFELDYQANQLHYLLGLAYRQIGDMAQARLHMDEAGDRIARIEDPWLITMQTHSQGADFYLGQGLMAAQGRMMKDAFNMFQLAALVDPNDPRAYVSMARASLAMGNLEAAEDFLGRALAIAPDDPNALFNVGLMNDQGGDTDTAIEYYQRAIEAQAGFADPMIYLGNALMRKGKYAEAASFYAQASQLHKQDAAVLHLEALAHLASRQCARAMAALDEALAINPAGGQTLQTRARTYATCPAATDEQKRIALDDAGDLYTQLPNLEHAETLAMAKAALGQYQEASDYQAQAMFEAIKAGGANKFPGLTENMERYRDQQPPVEAWPVTHPIFYPPPPKLTAPSEVDSPSPQSP